MKQRPKTVECVNKPIVSPPAGLSAFLTSRVGGLSKLGAPAGKLGSSAKSSATFALFTLVCGAQMNPC